MHDRIPPLEMTLDELREALVPLIAANAVFDGWSARAQADAAATLGVPADRARLAFPGGAVDMIDAWFATIDGAMLEKLPAAALAAMKISDRIRALVLARLAFVQPQREAVRRALATLAMPQNLVRAARLGWRTADCLWRAAGDTSTDLNHYSKRATLAAVYGATLLVWLDDESEGFADTRDFLDRRIAGILRFEKAKARFTPSAERRFSPARLLGRLRYPEA
jgi:ubiquinone biosynthesis protein COQ9